MFPYDVLTCVFVTNLLTMSDSAATYASDPPGSQPLRCSTSATSTVYGKRRTPLAESASKTRVRSRDSAAHRPARWRTRCSPTRSQMCLPSR